MEIYRRTFPNQKECIQLPSPPPIRAGGERGARGWKRGEAVGWAAAVLPAFLFPCWPLSGCLLPADVLIAHPAKAEACPSYRNLGFQEGRCFPRNKGSGRMRGEKWKMNVWGAEFLASQSRRVSFSTFNVGVLQK